MRASSPWENTFRSAIELALPIALAGLGGLWAERAGVVNIGLEGMMILGTSFGAYGGIAYGPWWGVAMGVAGGALGGLLHVVATVSFGVDHIISGVSINLLAVGITEYLTSVSWDGQSRGSPPPSPPTSSVFLTCSRSSRAPCGTWARRAGSSSPTSPTCWWRPPRTSRC